MKVEYLLIGHGMDGKIKKHDYPKDKLWVTEIKIEAAGSESQQRPVKTFTVQQYRYNNASYAVAVARSVTPEDIERLINKSKVKPIPEELL